jgi:hypothetical protein
MDEEEYVTVAEAAKIKGVSENTIRYAMEHAHLEHTPSVRIPATIKRVSLDAWEPAVYKGRSGVKKPRGQEGRPPKKPASE